MTTTSLIAAARRVHAGAFAGLRPLRGDDAELTLGWRLSKRASLLNRGSLTTEQQRAWIDQRPATELNYVIEMAGGVPVGMLSLIDIDLTHRRAEAARFLLGEEEVTRGLPVAVEAMKLLYEVAFDGVGLTKVYGTVAQDNPRMLRWQQYLGMQVEGCLRQHIVLNGHVQDLFAVGILESEFREIALPRMNGLIAMASRPTPMMKEPDR